MKYPVAVMRAGSGSQHIDQSVTCSSAGSDDGDDGGRGALLLTARLLLGTSLIRLVEDRAVHIRPELLRGKCTKIQQDIGQPALANLGPRAVLGRIVG